MPVVPLKTQNDAKRFLSATLKLRRKPFDPVPSWAFRSTPCGVLEVMTVTGHHGTFTTTEAQLWDVPEWRVPDREALERLHRSLKGSAAFDLPAALMELPTYDAKPLPPLCKVFDGIQKSKPTTAMHIDTKYLTLMSPLIELHTGPMCHAEISMRGAGKDLPAALISVSPWCEGVILGCKA